MSRGFMMPLSHFKVLWWCQMCDGSIEHTWTRRACCEFKTCSFFAFCLVYPAKTVSQFKGYWRNRPRFMARVWVYKLKPFKLFLPVYWQPLYHQSFPSINTPWRGSVLCKWASAGRLQMTLSTYSHRSVPWLMLLQSLDYLRLVFDVKTILVQQPRGSVGLFKSYCNHFFGQTDRITNGEKDI